MSDSAEKDLIYSTPHWDVRLNPNQKYLGRSVVVLKRPCQALSEVTEEEMLDICKVIKDMETVLKETFGATMFNWQCNMNDAYQVDPASPQVHYHVIPRYIHPVTFQGQKFNDERFGHPCSYEMQSVSEDKFKAILDALKTGISGRIGAQ